MVINLIILLLMILMLSFVFNSNHIINLLIILESMMLLLLIYLFMVLIEFNGNPYMFILMLTLSACEAALGLSILISMMRYYGNDFLNSIMSLKWFAKITY